MSKNQKLAKKKSDKIFSEIIRSLGVDEYTGSNKGQMQCAHIASRKFSNTRTDFRNAFCLSAGSHRYFHDHPLEFARFVRESWAGEHYDEVFRLARQATKVDWTERLKELDYIQKQLESGLITLKELRE